MTRAFVFGFLAVSLIAFLALASSPTWRRTATSFLVAQAQTAQTQPASRQTKSPRRLDNYDVRPRVNRSSSVGAVAGRKSGATDFQARENEVRSKAPLLLRHPRTTLRWSEVTNAPSRVVAESEPLSSPATEPLTSRGKSFLSENRELFKLTARDLSSLRVSRNDRNPGGTGSHVSYSQSVNGIDIFQASMSVHSDSNGAIVAVDGELIPNAASLANATIPTLSVDSALQKAESFVEATAGIQTKALSVSRSGDRRTTFSSNENFAKPVDARLVYFPLSSGSLRLAWEFTLWMAKSPDVYLVLVDAEKASLLFRHNYTTYDAPHGLVFTGESPRPNLPITSGNPFSVIRDDVRFQPAPYNGVDTFISGDVHFDWWAGASPTGLISNNVDAHLDRSPADNIPDSPRYIQADSNFSPNLDLTKAPTDSENQKSAQTNLFYWVNRFHDIMYLFGFTESAGNFQTNNFGLGGSGGDAVQADAQDGTGTNNANFSTPPDGSAGRVQMYLWSVGTSQLLDGDLDQSIILHELTHGLSNRLVGNGSGLTGNQSAGMGEGWSDYIALTLLAKSTDNVDGSYAVGQYAFNNYTRGIRRYPYSTNLTINPLTFGNIALNTEVHSVGEIWCMTLLEMRALLIKKYGFQEGQRQSIQLVVDGLKLTPAGPTFIDARDAILLADRLDNGGSNQCLLWQAFAKRGLGLRATTLGADDGAPIESFDTPPYCSDSGTLTIDKTSYLGGEMIHLYVGDRNAGSSVSVKVSSSVTGDQETITLSQEPQIPGSFKGQILIGGGRASFGDGVIQGSVAAGDVITVTYLDAISNAGTSSSISASAGLTLEKVLLFDDVESGNQGWIAGGSWGMTTAKSASATHSWTDSPFGNYANNSNTSLTSGIFNFSKLSDVTVQISHSYDLESNFDYGLVEYSIDGGNTWSMAAAFTGASGFIDSEIAIPALSNQSNARIRFRVLTDPSEQHDGWYIDDIRISGRSTDASAIKRSDSPTLRIDALTPAYGTPSGGTTVTISGDNFSDTGDTLVTFDGVPATSVNVISSSILTAVTPPHVAGTVVVRLRNRYGQASLGSAFTYYVTGSSATQPIITSLTPATGSTRGGLVVSIFGANFNPQTTVSFGTTSAVTSYKNPNTLAVVVPVGSVAGPVDVTVSNGSLTATLRGSFTYTLPVPPVISVSSPTPGQDVFAGGTASIAWSSSDDHFLTKHRISLFRDTSLVSEITAELGGGDRSYNWRVPSTLTLASNYRIRVIATDDEGVETESYTSTFNITRNWQSQTAMPSSLMRAAVVSDGSSLIVIGGRSTASSTNPVNYVRRFDPATSTWTSLANLPFAMSSLDGAVLNGRVYIPGGITDTSAISATYVYDIAANSWSTTSNAPLAASAYATALDSANSAIYVSGGLNINTAAISNLRVLDVTANRWTDLTPMKAVRYGHRSVFRNGKVYVAGGFGISGGLTTCEVYDIASGTWSDIAPLNRARAFPASSIITDTTGKVYWMLAAGEDSVTRATLNTVELYDFASNQWITLDDSFNLNTARTQTNGAVVGNYLYVVGGGTGSGSQPTASSLHEKIRVPLNLLLAGTAPSISVQQRQIGLSGYELKFEVSANAIGSGTAISLAATGLPPGATFVQDGATVNGGHAVFRWTPGPADVGHAYSFAISASNGTLSSSEVVGINVVAPSAAAVVDAASYKTGGIPQDSMASIFGSELSIRTAAAEALPLPYDLAGTSVYVNGQPAPILYASPSQVNFVMPSNLDAGPATVIVATAAGKYAVATTTVASSAPALFTQNAQGTGDAAALFTSDGINYVPGPLSVGPEVAATYLVLFGTGIRNAIAANPLDENGVAEAVTVTIDGINASVTYAGPQGYFAGLDQINVLIPSGLQPGPRKAQVVVKVNGVEANRVTIQLK